MSAVDTAPRPVLARLDAAVLARTPITAARIRYLASEPQAFAAACVARNPGAEVVFGSADLAPVDVVATDDLDGLLADPQAEAILAGAQLLVAALAPGPTPLKARLAAVEAQGLTVAHVHPASATGGYFDDRATNLAAVGPAGALPDDAAIETLVVVARRGGVPSLLHLRFVTFAPTLMDIRTRLPAQAMRTEPDLLVTHEKSPAPIPASTRDEPKVMVLQRPAPIEPSAWRRAIGSLAQAGWIVVLEYDDHPELVARVKARAVGEADWLRFAHVHAVQTSTTHLAELFGRYNPEVRLMPNAAFTREPFPETTPRRVFYGAVSRGAFAADVARSLAPAIADFPELEFVVVGDPAVFDALPTDRKQLHGYMPYDDYLRLMGTCSVSLAPIEGSEFQETKSDAKFLDASAQGVLTIASPTIYSGVMRHGRNGLIAATLADWGPMLAQAVRDPAASRQMARNAWEYVGGARMFANQIRMRHDWYRDLWARRDELNAALQKRFEA